MKDEVIGLFNLYPHYALLLSITLNILLAILGVIPSVFLTAANILFFGFWQGTLVSFAGESLGAFIAFLLYRLGFKKKLENRIKKHLRLAKLLEAEGAEAFKVIILLRLIPFIPAGVITFTAAVGRVKSSTFFIASSLGKIPALFIEAYAAYQVVAFGWQGKIIFMFVGVYLLFVVVKKWK